MRIRISALLLAFSLGALSLSGCLVGRIASTTNAYDHPNTITERGFTYVKKGVVAQYRVDGILPATLKRPAVLAKLSVAQNAYAKLWHAAGGLKQNQAFVNIVIESSFVKKVGFGAALFLVVNIYADVIQFQVGGGAAPPPPAGKVSPGQRKHATHVQRLIRRSILRAALRSQG